MTTMMERFEEYVENETDPEKIAGFIIGLLKEDEDLADLVIVSLINGK